MSAASQPYITPERYLELEERSEVRHEYYRGEMFAMAGATREHTLIAGNLSSELRGQLRGRPCEVYQSDMRVLIEATGLYTYPDVVAACGDLRFVDRTRTTLLNPSLVVEVLSPSTETYDRGTKFGMYETVPSVREIIFITQSQPLVEVYRRGEGPWLYTRLSSLDDVLVLESVHCRVRLSDLYDRIEFDEAPPLHPHHDELR